MGNKVFKPFSEEKIAKDEARRAAYREAHKEERRINSRERYKRLKAEGNLKSYKTLVRICCESPRHCGGSLPFNKGR